jgi:SAM-dependent methyltransferase
VIGELYEHALAGRARPEIEHTDGSRKPLSVAGWLHESPGDESILDRCEGPTLDIGSGPGRLTVALNERGIPALGIDVTPYAVDLARSSGALVMLRDVFDRVPGTGRWTTVLLADGNIGIGGDPAALLGRVAQLLAPHGHAIVELEPPGSPLRREQVRLCHAGSASAFGPATESTAQDWIKTYGIKYDVVIDPTDQLNNGTKPTFDPHSWIIDTKTMKIIHAIPGAPGSLLPYGLVSLLQ